MSSAYIIHWKSLLAFGKSFAYIIKKSVPMIDPCVICQTILRKKIQIVRIVSDLIDMCLASYMICHLFHSVLTLIIPFCGLRCQNL